MQSSCMHVTCITRIVINPQEKQEKEEQSWLSLTSILLKLLPKLEKLGFLLFRDLVKCWHFFIFHGELPENFGIDLLGSLL